MFATDRTTRQRTRRRVVAGLAALALGGSLVPSVAHADADPLDSGLIARYKLDETSGTSAANSAPGGTLGAGTVEGTASWNGGNGFSFGGGAQGAGNAIKLPNNLLTGLSAVSVDYDVYIEPTFTSGAYFMFTFGNSATYPNGTGYMFVSGNVQSNYRGTFASAGYSTELKTSKSTVLTKGVWKHVTYTVVGGTTAAPGRSFLYEDGVQVATNTAITAMPSDIATSTRNYLGRSAYGGDDSFRGKIRDFRIYNRELSAAESASLNSSSAEATLAGDAAQLSLGDTSAVSANLTLPAAAAGGEAITWATSDAAHVSAAGVVTRPAAGSSAVDVTLTATLALRGQTTTKTFTVTVLPVGAAAVSGVTVAPSSLTIGAGTTQTLKASVVPAAADQTVTWASSNTAVATVDSAGLVTAVANGTATVTAQTSDVAVKATVPVTVSASIRPGQILHYALDETSGTTAVDSSGHGRHGSIEGGAGLTGTNGVLFDGVNDYVKMPANVLAGLDSISVDFDVKIDPSLTGSYFIWSAGNTNGTAGNGYLFTTGNSFRTAIASGNWSTEQETAKGANLARGAWKHVTYTQTGSVGILYEDGVEVARNSAVTLTPGSIGSGTTVANYIGRSVYSGDAYFKGNVRGFALYNRALAPAEVTELAAPVSQGGLDADAAALTLGDTSTVTSNLTLPTSGSNGSTIAWASSNAAVVSASGVVTRPAHGQPNAQVTLTATLTKGAATTTRTFTVTVIADISAAERAAYDAEHLTVNGIDDVRGNLTLPTKGERGSTIVWASSVPGTITGTGEVTRPAYGQPATTVVLTATATNGGESASRTYTATVQPLAREVVKTGYAFSYFTGDSLAGEKIYFAASEGNNALAWNELNGGAAKITSTLGTKGLRDPFLIRSHEGDKWYLIATDLSIGGGTSWDASQRSGSQYIEVWESTDLVNWSEQRHVKVSPSNAGNTWAPEAYYDDTIGAYVVFWASKLYAEDDPGHTGSTYNRMMYATTRDFVTFTDPQIWQDTGKSLIDTTVLKEGDTYYRFTKDEGSASGCTDIIQEKSTDLRGVTPGTDWTVQLTCLSTQADSGSHASITRSEGPTIFKSNPGDVNGERYYLFVDEYGGRKYLPLTSTSLENPSWSMPTSWDLPASPRHGTVVNVTQTELNRLNGVAAPVITSTTSVELGSSSVNYGTGTTATATVSASDTGQVAGDVTFTVGDFSQTVALVDGVATVNLPANIAGGKAAVTAQYAGYDVVPSSSDVAELTIVPVDSATTASLSATTVTEGAAASVAVSVSAAGASGSAGATPTGSITVKQGTTVLGTATLFGGQAEVQLPRTLAVGAHDLTVLYSGDSSFRSSAGEVTLTVVKADVVTSVTSVSVTPAKVTSATAAKVAVAVRSATGAPVATTATVVVRQGSKAVVTRKVTTSATGAASTTLPKLKAGTYTITVTSAGTANVAGSSASITLKVAKATSKVKVKVTPKKVTSKVRSKVTVTVTAPARTAASGKVKITIKRGSKVVLKKTVKLSKSGKATVKVKKLPRGSYQVTAAYSGSANVTSGSASKAVKVRR